MPHPSPTFLAVARALEDSRRELALLLVDSVADWEKYAHQIGATDSREDFAARETMAFVDYLARYFGTGDSTYRDLYLGEKLKQCYTKEDGPEEAIARRARITQRDRESILRIATALASTERDLLAAELDAMHAVITKPTGNLCRVLLVGDCLYLDLLAFLTVPLLEAGVQLVPTFATSKLQPALRQELTQLQDREFDLVFYSPFTYEFHPSYAELQTVRGAVRPASAIDELVSASQRQTEATLQLIEGLFECPIFVHNSSNIRRHNGSATELLKGLITKSARSRARRRINEWLPGRLEALNGKSHRHLFLLDEISATGGESEHKLARYIYHSQLQHPARFAQAIAPAYRDIIAAQILLAKKKVIVCDLDNTLWRGVIGEGAVEHYTDRQRILQTLRQKGVLLAICSKNDPKNVHWLGGTLSESDFVCGRINWAPKVANIRQIASQLNLKTKDFIFVDDRADERELVKQALPEITVLDAESPASWRQLAVVAETMAESAEGDRTRAYAERETRQQFLAQVAPASALAEKLGVSLGVDFDSSEEAALSGLELQLSVRFASQRDLKRVSELINRTNQFNLCGSRTTLREVTQWHRSGQHAIVVAEARDKFGAMGIISVAVLEETTRGVEIPVFVLSCRVFGYGMETALLNCIRKWRPGRALYGHFKETPHNQPCHNVYPQNGFAWEGDIWRSAEGREIRDPPWLIVDRRQFASAP